ncbi:MAG: DUF6714 family protein [Methylococcaceae bacterium]
MDKLVEAKIKYAFSGASIPKGKLCSAEYDYEDAHWGFVGTTWEEHNVIFLREHESSLSFFTAEAFCYYLPAFMMAELQEPEMADIIAEGIAFHLTDTPLTKERISLLSRDQLLAIVAFFECCAARYHDSVNDTCFSKAADEVRKSINGS